MIGLSLLMSLSVTTDPLPQSVYEAIKDEIQYGIEATRDQDIDRYMETIPTDSRTLAEDGSLITREQLREMQLQAWAIIPRTNSISQTITGFELDCEGTCANVWTDQRWDRQMIGRDGKTEHHVVTTQKHKERWELRDSRWVSVDTEELGGTVTVDGETY